MSDITRICRILNGKINENNLRDKLRAKGIWALFGKKEGKYVCLNVGKCEDVGYEILYDISCMQNLVYSDSADIDLSNYINEFGEACGFKYENDKTQEYLYPYIRSGYEELIFLNVCDENDADKERLLAWLIHAKYWHDFHRPFRKERFNRYEECKGSVIGRRRPCSSWNSEEDIIVYLSDIV